MTRSIRGVRGWRTWWRIHRRGLLNPSYRARRLEDRMGRRVDEKARTRARERLLAALSEGHWLVSSEAALAVGRLGDARDIATLARIVRDPDVVSTRRTHRYAAVAMGLL